MTSQDFRKTPPLRREITSVELINPEIIRLDNGIMAYLLNTGTEEMMKIELLYEAGSFYQKQPLVAHFTAKCMIEGTPSHTAEAIAENVDFFGAHLKTMNTMDHAQVSLYCLTRHLEPLLPVFQEVNLLPVFPEKEITTIIAKTREEYLVNMEKVNFVAQQLFPSLAFGKNHPYGGSVDLKDYDNIQPALLLDFYKNHYFQGKIKIVAAGKLPENIAGLLNRYFGQQKVFSQNEQHDLAVIEPTTEEQFIFRENTLQSAIRLGKPLFNKLHPDFAGFQVLNTLLGGYFGSRLMTNIREDKGYTYGIGSGVASMLKAGLFFISAQVGVDVTQKAMDEVLYEIEKLRTEPVKREELDLVKNYILGSFLRSADGPFALAELVKGVIDYDLTMDFYENYVTTIKNITPEEIQRLAVNYLHPDSLIKLIVGKK